jgi:membrane-associated protease RseP (regulator of RpoE activity)
MSQIEPAPTSANPEEMAWLRTLLEGVFAVDDITTGAMSGRALRLRGRFLVETAQAYAWLAPRCRDHGYTLTFRREGQDVVLYVIGGLIQPTPNNRWLPIVLAAATILSMLFAYALFQEGVALTWANLIPSLMRGWAFTLSLLSILVTHELGHYFMARHFGVAVTLPYLIPFPLSPFGTLGAVIRMKDIPPSKRAMLLIGAAGPLAGLAVAIPVLLVGLRLSPVTPLPATGGYTLEGNSLLYAGLKYLIFGKLLPSGGIDVNLHPVAFAGWAGLLVTALNLLPAGQLDGGHVAHALLGDKSRYLNWGIIGLVLLLAIWWQGWLIWAVLIFVFSRVSVRPMDDVTLLTPRERALAIIMLVLFILTFTPIPLLLVP